MTRPKTALTVFVVFAALVMHLSVSWQDFSTLAKNGYLYDDSFYAFQISRNIAEGRGPSFDGVTPTNGFQPLYVYLLVPAYKLLGSDQVAPIYAALTLMALLTIATAVLLLLIARRYVSDWVALMAASLWVFSPVVVKQAANGLETALALFMIAWSIYYYLTRLRSDPRAGTGRFLKMGLLLGLTILARVDGVLFALVMALDYLLVVRGRAMKGAGGIGVRGVFVAAGTACAVYLPWAIYSYIVVGSIMPESGSATRFLSVAYAPFFGLGSSDLLANGPGLSFIWAHMEHAASVLKIAPPVHVVYRVVEKLGGSSPTTGTLLLLVNIMGWVAMAAFCVWWVRCWLSADKQKRGELSFLLLFSLLLIVAYSTYVFGVFFFTRYFYPVFFIATIFAGCVLQDIVNAVRRRPVVIRATAAAVFALYAVGLAYMGMNSAFRSTPVYHFYDVARWVKQNTSDDEKIGVFQGGAIGYLSGRQVVNLDGKVNGDALEALKRGDIGGYIDEVGIDLVMDHQSVLDLFLGPCSETELAGFAAKKCFNGASVGANGWVGFRVDSHREGARAASRNTYELLRDN